MSEVYYMETTTEVENTLWRWMYEATDQVRSDGCNCWRGLIKEFSDLPERDQGYVVSGAVFVVGLGILIAVIYVDWRRSRRPSAKI